MKVKIIIIYVLISNILIGQDFSFSQMNECPIWLNPANTGLYYPVRINTVYRQQWSNLPNPYRTYMLSSDFRLLNHASKGSSLCLGVLLANDVSGMSNLTVSVVKASLMGKVFLTDNQTLSAGLISGVFQRKIDSGKLTWSSQFNGYEYDSSIPHGENISYENIVVPDVGVGIQWSLGKGSRTLSSNDKFGAQLGISAFHLNRPDISFNAMTDNRYIRYLVHGSLSIGLKNSPIQINPMLYIQLQGPSRMYYWGSYVKYCFQESSKYTGNLLSRSLNVGLFYRQNDSFVFVIQLELDQYGIGISYDINSSELSMATHGRGAFEISLKYLPFKVSSGNKLL